MPHVRESENHGIGGINPGNGYIRSEKFGLAIVCSYENEDVVNETIAKIPNFHTDFQHIVIE